MSRGQEEIEQLLAGGFSDEEIQGYVSRTTTLLRQGGYSDEKIMAYFGQPPIDEEPMVDYSRQIIEANRPDTGTAEGATFEARGAWEAFQAGTQMGVGIPGVKGFGLAGRLEMPDMYLSEDPSLFEEIAYSLGTVTADLPSMAAGGAIAGGTTMGTGTLVGAFAAPAALREMYIQKLENGEVQNWGEFWERMAAVWVAEFKGGAVGYATAAGGAVGRTVGGKVVSAFPKLPGATPAITALAGEITAMTTAGAAVEGQIPSGRDFLVTAAVILPIKMAAYTPAAARATVQNVAAKLRRTYAEKGKTPADVEVDAVRDPSIKDDLASSNQDVPRAYRGEGERPQTLYQKLKEAQTRFVERYDEAIPDAGKPQGVYTTFVKEGVESPFREQGKRFLFERNDKNALDVTTKEDVRVLVRSSPNRATPAGGPIPASAGIQALMKLIPIERWNKLIELPREQLEAEFAKEFPGVDWTRPFDTYEMLEGYAGMLARQRGYDAIIARDVSSPEFSEFIALEKSALKPVIQEPTPPTPPVPPTAPPRGAEPPAGGESPGRPPTADEALAEVLDRISIGGKPARDWAFLSEFYRDWFDKLHPLKKVVDAMRDGKDLQTIENAYELARLHVGVAGKAHHFLDYSPFKFDTYERVGRPLKEILRDVQDDIRPFRAYLIAKRSLELEGRGIKTPGRREADRVHVERYAEQFEPIRTELREYQTHVLRYMRDSGIISDQVFKAMEEANRDYVPFYREMEASGFTGGAKGATVGRGLKVRQPIKPMKGDTELKIIDPIESIIKNTYLFMTLAERNEIMGALVKLAETSERGPEYARKVKRKARPIKLTDQEILNWLKKQEGGEAVEIGETPTIFRPGAFVPKRNEIAFFRKGKQEIWEVSDGLADVFNAMDSQQAAILMRFMSAPARLLRAGAVLAPEFVLRNPVRDQFSAYIFSESGYKPLADWARGIVHLTRKTELYQDWLRSGGPQSELVSLDRRYLQKGTRQLLEEVRFHERILNVFKSPIEALAVLSAAAEQGTRIGEFAKARGITGFRKSKIERQLREKGLPTKEEMLKYGLRTREVSLDFGRIGAKARTMNAITSFFNAQVQGANKMVRSMREHPIRTPARIFASITIPSIILRVLNEDEEGYHNIPQTIRDLTWPIAIPWNGETHWWYLPKPFDMGVIFGTGAEKITEYIMTQDPDAFDGLMKTIIRGATPSVVPQIAVPPIEVFANRSIFWDRPLIPSVTQGIYPEYQAYPYTTELTQAVGQMIASLPGQKDNVLASPAVIDSIISNWTGGLGRHLMALGDKALREAGILENYPGPAWTMADVPFIKAFKIRYPSASAEPIQQFMDGFMEVDKYNRTLAYLESRGEAKDFERELKRGREIGLEYVDYAYVNGVRESLANMKKEVWYIWKHPDETPEAKQQLIEQLYFDMIAVSIEGNKEFAAAERQLERQKESGGLQ